MTASSSPATAAPGAGRRHTVWVLVSYYVLAVLWGLRNIRRDRESGLDLFVPLAMAAALAWWTVADARRRGHPIPMLARPWFFLLFGVAVLGYVVWSRGRRGAGWVALHVVLWYLLAAAAMVAGGLAIYGEQWLDGI